jgi:hypothetical protein
MPQSIAAFGPACVMICGKGNCSRMLGVSRLSVSDLLHEKRVMTPEMAAEFTMPPHLSRRMLNY